MKIAFFTLGCKVNTYETESVWETFKENGYERVDYKDYADVYVINTCTVTNNGDVKSRKAIRRLIKKNPEAIIAVMGCYAQMSPDEIISIDGVDIVIGTKHRELLYDKVEDFKRSRKSVLDVTDVSRYREFDQVNVTHFTENTRAFLKIQDGCNNFCTYCIIPFARGPVRSRSKESILQEAKTLIKNGYHEIVLTGIHTGGYGQDLKDYSFYDLLVDLSQLQGIKRLRISSIEINELTDEILELISKNDVFAKHLHVPLQSGSDTILKAMRRKYDTLEYLNRINYFRTMIEDVAITTDVIVGFPGETDELFEEMKAFIETIGFSELHVFPYSKRSGTKAASMKEQIPNILKSMRVNELLELNNTLANRFIDQVKGKPMSVLFEHSDDNYTYGHSSHYIMVKTKKDTSLHNKVKETQYIDGNYKNITVKIA
jgi:threonylcarbamoyladenosine tRNA methylthiotransferase MtaB